MCRQRNRHGRRFLLTLFIFIMFPLSALATETVLSYGLDLYGELKYPAGFKHFDYVNPKAPKGGTLRQAAIGTFDTFNDFILKGIAAEGIGMIYDTLMAAAEDEPFSQYGLLAEKVELAVDRTFVIFHLNPRARFNDGQPVTAADVVFTFNLLLEQGQPMYKRYYADVVGVEALDSLRVKFIFKDGNNAELPLIVGQLVVLPQHFWQGKDFNQAGLDLPLGSGPYRIKSFISGKSVTYERVADYWAADLPVNKGRYNFDTLVYDYYRDATVALEAFKAGEYDFRHENVSKNWATLYNGPQFTDGRIIKKEIPHAIPQGMQGFVFNTRRALFADSRVREALIYAFDFEWSNKNLFYDQYKRSESYFSNSELAAAGPPSAAEKALLEPFRRQLPAAVFTDSYHLPQTDGLGNNRQNLRQAAALLRSAGWRIKDKKLVDGSGRPFNFEILLTSPAFERIVLPFKKNLDRLGIETQVRVVDTAQYLNRIREFDFDMVVWTFGQSLSPGNEQRYYWHSSVADVAGSRNLAGIKDPVVDALVEEIIHAGDRQSLVTRVRALDRVLQWGFYVIPHWHISTFRIAYWDKFAQPAQAPQYGLGLMTWWNKDKP
ncbi:MAG: ABC transporter substrate-binding protein [Deltaproteobacteria bacterium]|nr:ABC transporter substrate-binding protein [Deltaproteobacteria bacterium]